MIKSVNCGQNKRLRDELKILLSMKTTNNRLITIENNIGQYPMTMKIRSSFYMYKHVKLSDSIDE